MILYHGTYLEFKNIDLNKCADYKDFGKGFYATEIYDQAVAMAIRKARAFGGKPCVVSYEVSDNILKTENLRIKVFNKATTAWAKFVLNNRDREFIDFNDPLCNRDFKYDIVFGPVANDTLTTLIQQYKNKFISNSMLLAGMRYHSPSNQYSFHTEKAVKLLKKVDFKWIKNK